MKALLTAFTLLSFVAASTVPMIASAADPQGDKSMSDKSTMDKGSMTDKDKSAASSKHSKTMHKTAHKTTHKKSSKKKTHHKHVAKKGKMHKDSSKSPMPKAG